MEIKSFSQPETLVSEALRNAEVVEYAFKEIRLKHGRETISSV